MRVTQIADLAGTTPRAVRHYHRLGLLEVPPTVRGHRDYGVEHLARLLRIRWLADSGLTLRQVAQVLTSEDRPPALSDRTTGGDNREAVLGDLRATRGAIEAQRRSLAEQAVRIDELITRVEAGEALVPVPTALDRFYDALEDRIRVLGGDLRSLRTERQMVQVMGSLGMVPDSTVALIEAFDEEEMDLCAEQITAFSRLTSMRGEEGVRAAHALAERTYALSTRHKPLTLAVLDDLPDGAMGRAVWRLTHVLSVTGYPHPAQRAFAAHLLELLLSDPDFAATIRRSPGEDPAL